MTYLKHDYLDDRLYHHVTCMQSPPLKTQIHINATTKQQSQVTWAVDSEEGSSPDLFHVDLYNCGDDQACGSGSGDGGCLGGDLVQPLCPEEGCYSDGGGGTSVTLPKVKKRGMC